MVGRRRRWGEGGGGERAVMEREAVEREVVGRGQRWGEGGDGEGGSGEGGGG